MVESSMIRTALISRRHRQAVQAESGSVQVQAQVGCASVGWVDAVLCESRERVVCAASRSMSAGQGMHQEGAHSVSNCYPLVQARLMTTDQRHLSFIPHSQAHTLTHHSKHPHLTHNLTLDIR